MRKRTVLFRGKNKDKNSTFQETWVFGNLIIVQNRTYINPINGILKKHENNILTLENLPLIEVEPNTVGEYTGKVDIHGTKIYEDDITRCRMGEQFVKGIIVWEDNHGYFSFNYTNDDRNVLAGIAICNLEEIEVIGNVHDNPNK